MSNICILTDETAQFLDLSFAGQERVQLMPIEVVHGSNLTDAGQDLRALHLPTSAQESDIPYLSSPSVEQFVSVFTNLSIKYSEIVAILSSSGLTDCVKNAHDAAELTRGKCRVSIVDSGVVGIGLGILVAAAAERAAAGKLASEIKKDLMGLCGRVYAVFCIKNLLYLENLGIVTRSQAIVGEMLDVHQMFYLNSGTLIPVQKIRNSRHMVESVLEFVAEFSEPEQVAIQQAAFGYHQEARTIRERLNQEYDDLNISEMSLSVPLATLFGPQSFGLYLWEI